jgi:predicted glycosyltransferase
MLPAVPVRSPQQDSSSHQRRAYARILAVTILTVDGLTAVLDEAHWEAHIVSKHPELNESWDRVVETLQNPEGIFRSKRDPSTRIYVRGYSRIVISETLVEQLSLLVYVRERNGFVVTAHFAAAMWHSLGERIWPL